MILGNKSDMEDKRVVSTERGEAVKYQQFKFYLGYKNIIY